MVRRPLIVLAVLALALVACEGVALRDAERVDTPEAYEAFLQRYPASSRAGALRERIDTLRFLRAKVDGTSSAFREYLATHPDGMHAADARRQEDERSFREAAAAGTADALRGYLDAHPDGSRVEEARDAWARITYVPLVAVGEITVQRANMADDPKGPEDGWGLVTELTNGGDRPLRVVEVAIDYLDAGGAALQTDRWWAVAPDLGAFPTPPELRPALPPGGTRVLRWTTAERPNAWAEGRFAVRVTRVEFVQE
jgi:hypothetical protein